RKENSSQKENVVLSNGERTSPVSHFEFAARVIGYSKNYEKNLWEKKRKEVLTSDLSPGAILYLACIMGSYLSPKNKITSALEVNDDTKPYLFGNFIKKENPNFKERTLYSHNDLSTIFPPQSDNINLVSRKCELNIELSDLIKFSEAMEKEKDKRIHKEKRIFAHAEKDNIMGILSLPVLDEKLFLDETNDLQNGGDQLIKNMNKINNTKKRRI
uniref:hypothetical protein n=1 Tax=Leclercia adecarboxylata TaxID=83655 RepID=UPI00301A2560